MDVGADVCRVCSTWVCTACLHRAWMLCGVALRGDAFLMRSSFYLKPLDGTLFLKATLNLSPSNTAGSRAQCGPGAAAHCGGVQQTGLLRATPWLGATPPCRRPRVPPRAWPYVARCLLCSSAHARTHSCGLARNACEAHKSVRRRTHNLRRRAAHHRARIRVLLAHRSPACSSACVRQSGAKARSRSPALRSEWFRGPLTALPRRVRAPSHSAVRRPAPTRGPSSARLRRTQAPSRTAAQRPAPPRGLFLAQAKRT